MIRCYLLYVSLLFSTVVFSQGNDSVDVDSHNKPFHSLTLITANGFVPNSFYDNTNDILLVPVYGINYDFHFKKKWGLGIHTAIMLQQFKVEKHNDHEVVVRENPVSLAAILLFKPSHHWKIIGGYGIEMETHENFQFIKIGIEYGIDLPKNWELEFILENDFKINGYYTLLLGIGITKKFIKFR